jgi:hypothetical protein
MATHCTWCTCIHCLLRQTVAVAISAASCAITLLGCSPGPQGSTQHYLNTANAAQQPSYPPVCSSLHTQDSSHSSAPYPKQHPADAAAALLLLLLPRPSHHRHSTRHTTAHWVTRSRCILHPRGVVLPWMLLLLMWHWSWARCNVSNSCRPLLHLMGLHWG